ncbi:hypothetical protein AYR62_06540 [Secundilactobacillus paracollinoides]|uniref:cell wall elongation regulator TseB-like domain-containing protein n=1 Tax=Secundilactobacillus paracollinoides TaxID=240427 RepID=UPI0006D0798B|nr:DUF5590 domain-containing protein [Secundilactobacillus paracollinoides]ANZ63781.1 hypothetical protein AYR62_06540 [Secundilactobacillus paracollinoides]
MRREQSGRRRRGRRVLSSILVIIVILIIGTLWGYHHATAPINKVRSQSISMAEKYAGLKKESAFYWTNLNKTYYTVAGTNKQNKAIYVLVPQKGAQLRVMQQSDGLTRNQVLSKVWSQRNPKKVLSAALSVFNGKSAWIVSYMNKKGQLCYETLSFKSGKLLQLIENI